ncbi:uncharacterized protein MYCFIDRAFT_190924 [Pseudocercospora fijiensis CIRAD86]|uniref:Mitochondrial 2-oxoglutarate/malate carrier protein n=1 Tax=Pseudocercospora fijiensis (strain CIRAD86) TaxID=383855 RepID=M2YM11_PSEFD|nr:uncharacterized protein MYCFIDRAFT_190924 [Pseudocercospora fijiensis CIRAD86]EME78750.1 hypothetical protein MYCFIDRAFT_190924 [Pseudocercospora fijiensis CIRAD86]
MSKAGSNEAESSGTQVPFVIGGGSGMIATCCIQPADMVKVRLQLLGEGSAGKGQTPFAVARQIIRDGRFLDLYDGLSAGLLRQATYATMRLGFFDRFQTFFVVRAEAKGTTIGFRERAAASLSAGGLAAAIANPAEVALIRLQSDGMKPKAERANYKSVVDALVRIARNEGVFALWQGSYPTTIRAMSTNFGQLAFFSESKAQLKKRTSLSDRKVSLGASAIAGFFTAFFSLPFDFVKTRLQRGGSAYKGVFDCAVKVAQTEGLLRFYRGFGTYFVRIAPHTMITLVVADYVTALVKKAEEKVNEE